MNEPTCYNVVLDTEGVEVRRNVLNESCKGAAAAVVVCVLLIALITAIAIIIIAVVVQQ